MALLCTLVGLAYWDKVETEKEASNQEHANRVLKTVSDNVQTIRFTGLEQQEEILFQKDELGWKIVEPLKGATQADVVQNLLKNLTELDYVRIVHRDPEGHKQFGLEPPRRTIELIGNKGSVKFFIGEKAPVGYSQYLATSESPNVYLVSQAIELMTKKSLNDFRSREILQHKVERVKRISYRARGQDEMVFTLEDGLWNFVSQANFDADPQKILEFVETIHRLNASGFADQISTKDESDETLVEVKLSLEDNTTVNLDLFSRGDEYLASVNNSQQFYFITDGAQASLIKKAEDFRDLRLLRFDAQKVTGLEVDGTRFEKSDEGWTTSKATIDSESVHAFLVDLEFAEVEEVLNLPGKAAAMVGKEKVIKLISPEFKKGTVQMTTYRQEGHSLVEVEGRSSIFKVESSVFENLPTSSATSELGGNPPKKKL